ncbi:patatin-like phospholipase family protein [Pseudomonas aeruginosa]|uniref:patatin-like phospholipase family protein n=1 Tax=Pseudomonas aeruginosa TaxID=287 RepID=UPI002A69CA0D|nr:patatin-like phospholipase family protein [Pseudomonas aeruginosa]MDY1054250.1 patatin-like phospholipase family protein [Pseudomonas aeruginosa]HCG0885754.1 patatin-like phospholipase family protein [Pseudomonas aeruginosa]
MATTYFSHCWGVFEGGGVRAAAHAGAYAAAKQAGVVFGRVAGTSAGSIVAALVAAGASHHYVSEELQKTDFSRFLGPAQPRDTIFSAHPGWLKPLRQLTWGRVRLLADIALNSGLYSSHPLQDWLEERLQMLVRQGRVGGRQGPVRFSELLLPLHVVATDLTTGQPKVWSCETTPEDSVAAAVRCSCSIPFFYQAVSHQQSVLVDGGAVSNLPAFVFSDLLASGKSRSVLSRVIAFRLVDDPVNRGSIEGLQDFAVRLSNAAIDGASHIQLSLQPHVYLVTIPTGSIRSTDFESVGEEEKNTLHEAGSQAMREFIANERLIVRKSNSSLPYQGFDEKMLLLVQELQDCHNVFLAVGPSTYWLEFVFPTILSLARRGVQIVLIAPPPGDINEQRRHWLLRELGAEVIDPQSARLFDGFVFDPESDKASALLSTVDGTSAAISDYVREKVSLYTKNSDPAVLEMLREKLSPLWRPRQVEPRLFPYAPCSDVELFNRLRTIPHYANAKFRMADVDVCDDILVLQQSVKEFKLLQIKHHMSDLQRNGCDLFELIEVSLPGGRGTIVTPPVLERIGEKLVLIDGNTRFFHCLANGITSVRAVIADNVTAPLPAQRPRPLSTLKLVSSTTPVDAMYTNVDRSLFRRIEEAVHPYP